MRIFFFVRVHSVLLPALSLLHLLSHNFILITHAKIGTFIKSICQKTSHLILIQVHITHIIFKFLVIHIIHAHLTVGCSTHRVPSSPICSKINLKYCSTKFISVSWYSILAPTTSSISLNTKSPFASIKKSIPTKPKENLSIIF